MLVQLVQMGLCLALLLVDRSGCFALMSLVGCSLPTHTIKSLCILGMVSLTGLPSAGDGLQHGSGVFLCASKAWTISSLFRSPFRSTLFIRRHLFLQLQL